MKEYTSPVIEYFEFEDIDIITTSPDDPCPNTYGNTCSGNPYGGG